MSWHIMMLALSNIRQMLHTTFKFMTPSKHRIVSLEHALCQNNPATCRAVAGLLLQVGEMSGPVFTDSGVHLILRTA